MGEISVSDIVFVTFPFSDLSQTKLRPALVLANAQRIYWILCQITSQSYYDTQAITIDVADYREGFLSQVSFVSTSTGSHALRGNRVRTRQRPAS
jgi:mRNA interferase MazF